MTHFTVLVCAHDPEELETLLAPYDENMEAPPRREYVEGQPQDYWLYKSYREDWEKALKTPEGQDKELEARARMFLKLSDPPTWAEIAWLANTAYPDDGRMYLDEDMPGGARAYTMTTYNPASKWDWYSVGGRWAGSLRYKPGCADQVLNADEGQSESGFGWDPRTVSALHCDGGPKRALDLEGTRAEAAATARKRREEWQQVITGTPEAMSWAGFRARVDSEPGYTIEQAREDYAAQPRVQALKDTDFRWWDDAIAHFQRPPEVLEEEARAKAVPGYALVRLNGTWLAPGEMGWWAMSSDDENSRLAYQEAANAYIDALPDDAWLIVVDCHI